MWVRTVTLQTAILLLGTSMVLLLYKFDEARLAHVIIIRGKLDILQGIAYN